LEDLGYEVLVFHATGTGGESMERLAREGRLTGILDVTTTELADELVGGVFASGPQRLAPTDKPVPRVVSVGAMDMVNFGPEATVPDRFRSRALHVHNSSVTLMRTTREEMATLGRILADRLSHLLAPTVAFLPLRGVSALSVEGAPFYDHDADQALFEALRANLEPVIECRELDTDINDQMFATAMADRLHSMIKEEELNEV
jgi:uncharacterized protein (UPF0261 family)